MKFEDALKALREGKRIRQPCECYYVMDINPNYETIIDHHGDVISLTGVRLLSDDWEVLKDKE